MEMPAIVDCVMEGALMAKAPKAPSTVWAGVKMPSPMTCDEDSRVFISQAVGPSESIQPEKGEKVPSLLITCQEMAGRV